MKQKLIEIGTEGFDTVINEKEKIYSSDYVDSLLNDGWEIKNIVRESNYIMLILFEHV